MIPMKGMEPSQAIKIAVGSKKKTVRLGVAGARIKDQQ
jgi:hypothetical protein